MPGFDALAPDQQAVLQLLLKRGKGYDDIAGLLRLDRASVRERALDALDALGADAPSPAAELSPERQDEVADHLLGQQAVTERAATARFLEGSAPGRAWARAVTAQLEPVGAETLPAIPAEPAPKPTAGRAQRPSSKRGGALVLLAVALAAIVGVTLLLTRGGDDEPAARSASASTGGATTGTTDVSGLPQQQINFTPPQGSASKALAYAIIAEGQFAVQAEGLAPSDLYGVWLYNSREQALQLGFAGYDRTSRRLAGAASLPAEAADYRSIVITRQSTRTPRGPGRIVLRGTIKRQ